MESMLVLIGLLACSMVIAGCCVIGPSDSDTTEEYEYERNSSKCYSDEDIEKLINTDGRSYEADKTNVLRATAMLKNNELEGC